MLFIVQTIVVVLSYIHVTVCYLMYEIVKKNHINTLNNKLSHVCYVKQLSVVLTINNIIPF